MALAGISFHAQPGQIYGLLGPERGRQDDRPADPQHRASPDQRHGHDQRLRRGRRSPREVRRQIGFMSANTAVYDRMTGWEMVEYFGRLHGIARDELARRMEILFDRLKMNDTRDVLGAKMSTGMKQKVSVARAVVHDPPVLIFDEATVGPGRAGRPGAAENRGRAARSWQVHRLFDAHHERGGETLRPGRHHAPRAAFSPKGRLEELRDLHHERDLEELFFQLISQHDEADRELAPA